MATAYEIAAHISSRMGGVDRFKLHKLMYYVQAWSLVWRDRPAFDARIEGWVNGPVVARLQADLVHNCGGFMSGAAPLNSEDAALVDHVLLAYGNMTAEQLIKLTHAEKPWKDSRVGLRVHDHGSAEITCAAMKAYYSRQWTDAQQIRSEIESPPAFVGSVDELERFLNHS